MQITSHTNNEVNTRKKKGEQVFVTSNLNYMSNYESLHNDILAKVDFGPLKDLVEDINVTDINWNGRQLWIDDIVNGRYLSDFIFSPDFIVIFSQQIANFANKSLTPYEQSLETEVGDIRVSIIHESAAISGRSISIRKSPAIKRLSREGMIKEGYATPEMLDFLQKCVEKHRNIIICGLPGVGKTELVKWLTTFIPPHERVVTIEDNLELHYPQINPDKDCVELRVSLNKEDGMTYADAIRVSLRQLAKWIILSEVRGKESYNLLEAFSTGCHGITTVHTDSVYKIVDRFKSMIGEDNDYYENEIYKLIDVAVLVEQKIENNQIKRYISQIALFERTPEYENRIVPIVDNKNNKQDYRNNNTEGEHMYE